MKMMRDEKMLKREGDGMRYRGERDEMMDDPRTVRRGEKEKGESAIGFFDLVVASRGREEREKRFSRLTTRRLLFLNRRSLKLLHKLLLRRIHRLVVEVDGLSESLDVLLRELSSSEQLSSEGVSLGDIGGEIVEELDGGGESETRRKKKRRRRKVSEREEIRIEGERKGTNPALKSSAETADSSAALAMS